LIKEANMWGIVLYIAAGGTANTDFIKGFTSKDEADAAADQIHKDFGFGYTVVTSVICITGCS
jgi:hypothetical protein